MKNTKIVYILSIVLLAGMFSCDDLIEKDLRDEHVSLLTPQDSDSLLNYTVTFWWAEVDGATEYRLQIVEPDFDLPTNILADVVISDHTYSHTLYPGTFQWRVKALNSSTETAYSTRTISIIENDDLSNEEVVLISPSNNSYANTTDNTFDWYPVSKADDYRFELRDDAGNLYVPVEILTQDELTISGMVEGAYTWSVQAQNASSVTVPTARSITIDTTPPDAPTLVSPAQNEEVNMPNVLFDWTSGNSVAPITDSLLIYSDSLTTLWNTYTTSEQEYSVSFSSSGTYFWRVRSVDAAGNTGSYSEVRKVVVN